MASSAAPKQLEPTATDIHQSPETPLKVSFIQIGDIIITTRTFASSTTEFQEVLNQSLLRIPTLRTIAMKSEGFMDFSVYPSSYNSWLSEAELCLFKVEVPLVTMDERNESGNAKGRLERKALKSANLASQGTVVKYGQQVQLRHVHSGGYLSLSLLEAAKEPGTFSIVISQAKTHFLNCVTLQPDNKLQKVGEPIKYSDKVEIEFQDGSLKHYLHLCQSRADDRLSIVGSHHTSSWSFICYQEINTVTELFTCGALAQVKLVNSVLHLSQKVNTSQANLRGDENDYSGFWIAEREKNMTGGSIHFGDKFHIKNARSGLYLSSDFSLQVLPERGSALQLPKPESFKTNFQVSYKFPVIFSFEDERKLASAVSERKEEIMSQIVPRGTEETTEEQTLEAALMLDVSQGKDVLFELVELAAPEANFLSQMSKIVPKLGDFQLKLSNWIHGNPSDLSENAQMLSQVKMVQAALMRASAIISHAEGPDTHECRQSIIVGIGVHEVLISIASTVSQIQTKSPDSELETEIVTQAQEMVKAIWTFLIEVVADNAFASAQMERQKEVICRIVSTNKHLIGSLLSEVYRLTDPEMPDYVNDFKAWCDRLEPVSEENVLEQTVFVKLIRCLCEVGESVKVEYQKVIINYLFVENLFFLVQLVEYQGEHFVHFFSKSVEAQSVAQFSYLNPSITLNQDLTRQRHTPFVSLESLKPNYVYIEYLSHALLLINTLCKGTLEDGKMIARGDLGLTSDVLMGLLQSKSTHLKIREACLSLADTLFVSCAPYKSTLERKKEDFCYTSRDLTSGEGESVLRDPLDTEKLQTKEVRMCLQMTLSLWIQKDIPVYLKGYSKAHVLDYLTASLRVSHSLLAYEHCSHLYANCIARGLAFVLIGMREDSREPNAKHWVYSLMHSAAKEMHKNMDLRVLLNDVLLVLVQLLMAIDCFTRQRQMVRLISSCLRPDFQTVFHEHPTVLTDLIDSVNDPQESSNALKKMLETAFTLSMSSEQSMDNTPIRPGRHLFSRDLLLRGPDTKECIFQLVLTWNSVNSALKETVISLLRQTYNTKGIISQFLRNADIISEPSIIRSCTALREYKEEHNMYQEAMNAKFELQRTGSSSSVDHLCEMLEFVTNYINPRVRTSKYYLEKMQNVMRHLSWHKQVMVLWPVLLQLNRIEKTEVAEKSVSRISTLVVCFLLCFSRNNSRNRVELLALFQSNFYDLKVPQYPDLIREITGLELVTAEFAQRLVTYLLDKVEPEHSSAFMKVIMFSREGSPRVDVQNIIARMVSEHLATRSEPVPALLQTLAFACLDNSSAVVLCRAFLPLDKLQSIALQTDSPELLESLLMFLSLVHLRSNLNLPFPTGDTAVTIQVIEQILKCVEPIFSGEIDIVESARLGLFDQVYPVANPTIVDEMLTLELKNKTRATFHLFSSGTRKKSRGGLIGMLWRILHALNNKPRDIIPLAVKIRTKLIAFKDVVLILQLNNSDLNFSVCQRSVDSCISEIDGFMSRNNEEFDKMDALRHMAQLFARGIRRKKKTQCTKPFVENNELDLRLRELTSLYCSRAESAENRSYLAELAQVFNDLVFKGHVLSKISKESVNVMVKMLKKIKRVFAGTRYRRMYFNFLEKLVPEVESDQDLRRKYVYNQVFMRSEVIEEAVFAVIQGQTVSEASAALEFLNALMDEQTKEFQDEFRKLIDKGEQSYYLFVRIRSELETVKLQLMDAAEKLVAKPKSPFSVLDIHPTDASVKEAPEAEEDVVSGRERYIINALIFLQLCCDNCNVDNQNYIRSQQKQAGLADVDLVTEVALFMIDLSSTGSFVRENKAACKLMVKAIAALLDFVTGPCVGNQLALGNSVPLFLAINKLMSVTLFEVSSRANKLHNKMCIFLHTLLEGEADISIYQTMLQFLDLTLLREGVEKFYYQYVKGREEDFRLELDTIDPLVSAKLKSMILQAIFLLKLKKFQRHHRELKKFSSQGLYEENAYNFYVRYIGYVEVNKSGVIQSHYFPIPFKCKFLTLSSRVSLLQDVNRNSHQKKIEDFMGRVEVYMREMTHQQMLSKSKTLKRCIAQWQLYAQMSFIFVLIINLQILFTFSGTLKESMEQHPVNIIIITVMGIMQLLLYMISFVFNLLEYLPNKLSMGVPFKGAEINKYSKFPHNESQYITEIFKELNSNQVHKESFENSLKEIFNNLDFYYNYIYFLISVIAIYQPLMYPVLLLDLVKQNQELINVLKSITVNARQLIITLCLGMIIIFLFSVYAFVYFQQHYDPSNGVSCHDVLNCFTSTLNIGVRASGGIGDGLVFPDYSGPDYSSRMTFDLLFYLIIIIILLNIIFGIIIDTFAQLRNQRSLVLEDINTRCYVCGTERSEIELHGKGWTYHFMAEHSPLAYLSFLVYLIEMPIVDCAGIEKYVKEKYTKRDSSFMPTTSKLLQTKLNQKLET